MQSPEKRSKRCGHPPAGRPTPELAGDRPKKRRAPTLELDRKLVFFNTVGTCVFILDLSGYVSEVSGTMVWGLVLYLRAFPTSSDSVASLVCLVPVETRRAMHDSHRLLADHNGRAVHDRSRYRHGSSRSECLPQSATGFSLFISFHHFSRPSCPVRLRRSTSSGKLDFLGDEFPVSSSTALCPQCFNMFRAHLFFHCDCESCYHCLQSCKSCHHFGDGVSLGHGKDFFDGCQVCGCSKRASQVDWCVSW